MLAMIAIVYARDIPFYESIHNDSIKPGGVASQADLVQPATEPFVYKETNDAR